MRRCWARVVAGVRLTPRPTSVPTAVPGVPTSVLDPRGAWPDAEAYDRQARRLKAMFDSNIERIGESASAAG